MSILEAIGHTPIAKLNRLVRGRGRRLRDIGVELLQQIKSGDLFTRSGSFLMRLRVRFTFDHR